MSRLKRRFVFQRVFLQPLEADLVRMNYKLSEASVLLQPLEADLVRTNYKCIRGESPLTTVRSRFSADELQMHPRRMSSYNR